MTPRAGDEAMGVRRIRAVGVVILGIMLFLVAYLWRMQALGGERYAELAKTNYVRLVREPAARGTIYDRDGEVLADSRPGFDVEVVLEDIEDEDFIVGTLAGILELDEDAVRRRLRGHREFSYLPVTVESDVSLEKVVAVEERQPSLAGVHVGAYPRRRYRFGATTAHLIGYVGKISPAELDLLKAKGYSRQDLIGKSGIEKEYEEYLAGRVGGEKIQVDNRGYLDKVLYRRVPQPGADIYLNLDLGTQRAAERALAGGGGAVVAIEARGGGILALASAPSFDPNELVPPAGSEDVRRILTDPAHPLMNRAIQGLYPPGSVFKPIVALAALSGGAIDEQTAFHCGGVFYLGRHPYKCWREEGHGRVSVVDAIMLSCNVFFYNTGRRAGRDALVGMASDFGFMEKSGIDLPGERAGVVPSARWRAARGIGRWNPGDTVVMAIGQGYLLLTPLRAAMMMAAIANGGEIYRPRVASKIVSPLGDTLLEVRPDLTGEVPLSEKSLSLVREGLRRGVNSDFGTGQKARIKGIEVAGKTGTVQVGPPGARKNHSWFVGYAPWEDPEIVVAVILEEKESGGFYAAPAAREVFEAYFKRD